MEIKEFKSEIEDAIRLYASDYARSIGYKITDETPEYLQAVITIEDYNGEDWEITIIESLEEDDETVIDIGNDAHLPLSPEGLYCYLWLQACRKLYR